MDDFAQRPGLVCGLGIEQACVQAGQPCLVADRKLGQTAGGFVEVDFGEAGEVGVGRGHAAVPHVRDGWQTGEPAVDFGEVVEQ